ncbi:MAG TPA: hypothetical protein VF746_16845 [Longimicrobium sp.]|jgi:hypothetical protein
MVKGSAFLTASVVALPLLLAAAFVAAVHASAARRGLDRGHAVRSAGRAAAGVAAWLLLTGGLAAAGRLTFGMPPTVMVMIVVMLVLTVRLGFSPLGERLALGVPLAALVGVQAFRLPLELLLHRAYTEGLMPEQMSYSGLNFDIVTGVLALVAAGLLAAGRLPRRGVAAWNAIGFVLLLNILTIAILSTPTPLRVFDNEPANTWIAAFPWVWLPAVMVPAALLGHILVFRRLRAERAAAAERAPVARTAVLA